jgi:transcriptional regulator with XRE-family HTH domain
VTEPVPERNQKAFNLALGVAREKAGLTLDQAAEKAGLARRTVSNAESIKKLGNPMMSTLHDLAHAYGVPFDELMRHLCEGHPLPGAPEN